MRSSAWELRSEGCGAGTAGASSSQRRRARSRLAASSAANRVGRVANSTGAASGGPRRLSRCTHRLPCSLTAPSSSRRSGAGDDSCCARKGRNTNSSLLCAWAAICRRRRWALRASGSQASTLATSAHCSASRVAQSSATPRPCSLACTHSRRCRLSWRAPSAGPKGQYGARQLNLQRLLCVQANEQGRGVALLWATREALQCADVASVLAWLPEARSAHLRRLQIAAHAHNKLLFVFRPLRAQHESSPAPLRLLLEGAVSEQGNLWVHLLKRRGPPLAAPVLLATRPTRLAALLAASRERARRRWEELAPAVPAPHPSLRSSHALDRIASLHQT